MTDKILEITEKIYNEGVLKAKEDADKIIDEAKKEAAEIIKSAKKQEAEIVIQSKIQAEEIKKNTNSEIQLAAQQFISKLKQQISGLITTSQVDSAVKNSFNDHEFTKGIIQTIIKNWDPQKPEELDLKILLPENDQKEFSDFFNSKAIDTLNKGIEVEFDSKTKTGFKIGPKDDSYIISFSEKDFENYFKGYFKERTRKLLFDTSQ